MEQSIKWKHGARCAVMISFDVDGESPWILRDPALAERPLHMGMGAYGPKTGMPRILRILDRYDLKCGFFIPAGSSSATPIWPARCCGGAARRGPHESPPRNPSSSPG